MTGVHLPTGYYIGASAATGELAGKDDLAFLFQEKNESIVNFNFFN